MCYNESNKWWRCLDLDFLHSDILPFLRTIRVTDIIDISIVAVVIYYIIKHFRKTRAAQLIKGIAIILIVTYLAEWLNLNVISFVLGNVIQIGFIALVIIFQPELRRALEHVGRSKFGLWFTDEKSDHQDMVAEVARAAESMSKTNTGALIVFEKEVSLDDLLTGGTLINADVSSELLENIFVHNTPLHDGAVIIRNGKIYKAACVLPLSSNRDLSKECGTRHRAALGISEQSDCVSLVVSEETGKISVMNRGNMIRNLSVATLSELLVKVLEPKDEVPENVKKNLDIIKNYTEKLKKKNEDKNEEN
ncbi:MAG: diadenylate cyclase CdaA [Clostridia bacterium]|nr:diadenylate cyclase CdaA [Clostridia bacterium]